MQQKLQRSAAPMQHRTGESIDASWEDLKVFLACVEHRSFRRGAQTLGMTDTTVMRRIGRLEAALGFALFVRHQSGLQLTDEGRAILDDARKMERASFDILRRAAQADPDLKGVVRIAATEGIGAYWVLPKLVDFQAAYRSLTVDLRCAMEPASVSRLETDIAIQFQPPDDPDLIVSRLGRLHVYPFASRSYIRDFGLPATIADLGDHRVVLQLAPQLDETAYARLMGLDILAAMPGIRTNSSTATLYAVERGVGIGMLPTYTLAMGARLVPVDLGLHHHLDLWLTYHPELKRSARHMLMVDWLKRIFDPALHPCFRDEFIHPAVLADRMGKEARVMTQGGHLALAPQPERDKD
ncbi:LysR family transcriptional regulator [Phreatobacter sp. AB_2022a]|uniref:LysR family transcriptional regulator n=1 Tax=Phreatobacter sp. AB_2022a TaxID=3003134 RepID=UPI0022872FCF|nr:LysR family transcriptional regulator [Phreatobacter sp. AB_2022a]MCZ0738331.1 LysR family transcriptional regulator [Phreatobacter sp. AB_2022a]